jgi:antitoxin component YwqK of YwqJK toxin-antitoxin module
MNSNKKFVILLEILVITFLVMSVVTVCGLSDSSADISAYPSIVNPGDEIRVTYSGAPGYFWDHIVMYKVGDQDEGEYGEWQVLKGEKSGTLFFTAPDEPGDYEFRLFESFELPYIARSNIVTVQAGTLPTSEEAVVLFEANFDDGYAPGFGNEVGDWEVHLFTGKYTATTDTYRFSMAGDTNWQDYVIEADFFNAQDGGLLVRAQDQDNCIALIVRPSYNVIYWYVRKGGMWADYKGQVTLGHEPGTEFPKGKIGLYLYYQPDQYWDNVVVYSSGATGPAPTPTTQEPSVDELPEFIFGNIETFDFDNDGSEDKYVYSFDREEVAEDLFLDKSMELDKTDSGFSGKIILRFENTGDKAIEYSHIEVIPKSFAESVDELEFSRPPDRVIEEDPTVKWVITLPRQAMNTITSYVPGFDWYPMDVDTFSEMTEDEKLKWIHKQIDPYEENIRAAAKKHNIPPRLLATVILNELADYNFIDQFQEIVFYRGSVGMAQININTAKEHGLVDVTEDDINEFLGTETLPVKPQEDPFRSVGPMQPGEAEYSLEEHLRSIREYAIDYITWERLNQPEYAIEGAAREINWILENVNKNLDKTWAKSLLKGPIDRSDPYANLKIETDERFVKTEEELQAYRECTLALLVIGPYNDESLPSSTFDLSSPYEDREEGQSYFNSINHAFNGMDLFASLLIKYGFFEEKDEEGEEEEDTSDGEFNCPIPIPKEAKHIVTDTSEYWSTPNGFVGPYYSWFDREKTKKSHFSCYNIEGERHGLDKIWCEDGTLFIEHNYKDGKLHGVTKRWCKDGTLYIEHNYKDGKSHGVTKRWYGDGTLFIEYNYKDGKLHGVYKSWYEDGTPQFERNYKDDKKHGVSKMWREDGTPKYERNYKDDKKHGVCKEWYANGVMYECNYEEGKCVSCVHGDC